MAETTGPSFRDHFSQAAERYASHRPTYPTVLAEFLAGLCARRELAWDSGCGSGQLSLLLAEHFRRVVATDASAQQLTRARPHPRVEYRQARAEDCGLPDGAADLCVAAQAAHWFDLDAYYAEVRRVAAPGGVLALATYDVMSVGPDVDPVIHHFYRNVVGPFWPPERIHTEDGYRTLPFPFAELAAPPLEMRMDWTVEDALGYIGTWSASLAMQRAEGPARFLEFDRALRAAWARGPERRPVRWPLSLRVARVGALR